MVFVIGEAIMIPEEKILTLKKVKKEHSQPPKSPLDGFGRSAGPTLDELLPGMP